MEPPRTMNPWRCGKFRRPLCSLRVRRQWTGQSVASPIMWCLWKIWCSTLPSMKPPNPRPSSNPDALEELLDAVGHSWGHLLVLSHEDVVEVVGRACEISRTGVTRRPPDQPVHDGDLHAAGRKSEGPIGEEHPDRSRQLSVTQPRSQAMTVACLGRATVRLQPFLSSSRGHPTAPRQRPG